MATALRTAALAEAHAHPRGTLAREPRMAAYPQITTLNPSRQAPEPRHGEGRHPAAEHLPGPLELVPESLAATMPQRPAEITRHPRQVRTAAFRLPAPLHPPLGPGRIVLQHQVPLLPLVALRNDRTTHLHRQALMVVRMMLRRQLWAAWRLLQGRMGTVMMGDRGMMKERPVLDSLRFPMHCRPWRTLGG